MRSLSIALTDDTHELQYLAHVSTRERERERGAYKVLGWALQNILSVIEW